MVRRFLFHRPTLVSAMSTMNRLLGVLGWVTPNEEDFCWGDPPPVKPSDRRSSPRHVATPNEAHLGWWVGEGFHSVAGQFHDISAGGAMIFTTEVPPYQEVWIGLAKPVETRWCPVKVVRWRKIADGLIEVGLAFHSPCDSALFDVVVQPDHLVQKHPSMEVARDATLPDALPT
jgi:hypothetical protein